MIKLLEGEGRVSGGSERQPDAACGDSGSVHARCRQQLAIKDEIINSQYGIIHQLQDKYNKAQLQLRDERKTSGSTQTQQPSHNQADTLTQRLYSQAEEEGYYPHIFQESQQQMPLQHCTSQIDLSHVQKSKALKTDVSEADAGRSQLASPQRCLFQSLVLPCSPQKALSQSMLSLSGRRPHPSAKQVRLVVPGQESHPLQLRPKMVQYLQSSPSQIRFVPENYKLCVQCKIMKKSSCFSTYPGIRDYVCRQCLDREFELRKQIQKSALQKSALALQSISAGQCDAEPLNKAKQPDCLQKLDALLSCNSQTKQPVTRLQ